MGLWQEDVERVLDARQDGKDSPFFYRLGPFYELDYLNDLKEAEAKIERLIKAGDDMAYAVIGEQQMTADEAWEEAKR